MAQPNYDDVPVHTGQPPAAPGNSAGFFQPPVQTANGILATDQARAVAEVQAALVIAAGRPRNEFQARDRLLQACTRVNLASGALYQYSRGGTSISGASIRLAEAAARAWGNMTYGFRELSRRIGESECEAFAWDLETNTKAVRQFNIRHRRDTKQGGYDLKDERDIYELMANQAQRRVRAAILEIIPGDIIEDAVEQCEKTMKADVGPVMESAEKLVATFGAIGVPREAIEKRLGHRIEAIQAAQVLNFRKIYASIRDGMSEPKDWFELGDADQTKAETAKETSKPGRKSPKGTAGGNSAPAAPIGQDSPAVETADSAGKVAPAGDPESESSAYTVYCPKTRKDIDELDCASCDGREGCASWKEA